MTLSSGFHSSGPNKVCKLQKFLYGLRQEPQEWFAKLSSKITSFWFCDIVYGLFFIHLQER